LGVGGNTEDIVVTDDNVAEYEEELDKWRSEQRQQLVKK